MIYYGIVDTIKDEHKSGFYGRRKFTDEEIKTFSLSNKSDLLALALGTIISPLALTYFLFKKKSGDIVLQYEENKEGRKLIFDNRILNDNYSFERQADLFYGLFDNFLSEEKALETILKSKGGSILIIIERNALPRSMHFGGVSGRFNYGLYCIHPKDENLLIPLENSNELIKSLILEETIRAYEALGAKKILIEDTTIVNTGLGGAYNGVVGNLNVNFEKQILREKQFGTGIFDTDRALKDSLFIHDFPNIMTTIKGRIDGNQTIEKFSENVNLSVGLDVGVLNLFSVNANFEYNRKWNFEVEFYDKNN
jgi:hypothetical protein